MLLRLSRSLYLNEFRCRGAQHTKAIQDQGSSLNQGRNEPVFVLTQSPKESFSLSFPHLQSTTETVFVCHRDSWIRVLNLKSRGLQHLQKDVIWWKLPNKSSISSRVTTNNHWMEKLFRGMVRSSQGSFKCP